METNLDDVLKKMPEETCKSTTYPNEQTRSKNEELNYLNPTQVNSSSKSTCNIGLDINLRHEENDVGIIKEHTTEVASNNKHQQIQELKPIICEKVSKLLEKLHLDEVECSFTIKDFYKFALKFYKDKSGKAVHLSYEDNCYFVALSQQILNGPFNPATAGTLGVLDVVGRDRRIAWQSLGDLSKEDAMNQFIERLHQLTPTFRPYIEAVLADHMEKERLKKEEAQRLKEEEDERKEQEQLLKKAEEERRKQEETKRQIQEALNQQTFSQFKLYAEQQFPGNPEQQAVLIKQLQEQHYQQYMQQVYQQQLLQQQKIGPSTQAEDQATDPLKNMAEEEETLSGDNSAIHNGEGAAEEEIHVDEDGNEKSIAPAHIWTRRDIKEFKSSIKQEGGDSIIKIGHGETVTVRVPTHPDGACLFWEFATDNYDIGFGVIFEWRKDAASTGVTVHVTDSDDEDDDEEEEEEEETEGNDIERTAGSRKTKEPPKYPQSVIIPVYRRDSHEEVYSGSHYYPGSGVYLLKFDNSYSLWRNKVLYYRVYYTQR